MDKRAWGFVIVMAISVSLIVCALSITSHAISMYEEEEVPTGTYDKVYGDPYITDNGTAVSNVTYERTMELKATDNAERWKNIAFGSWIVLVILLPTSWGIFFLVVVVKEEE